MTLGWAFPIAFALAVLAHFPAAAQSGIPGAAGACQQLTSDRDEASRHGRALQAAGRRKASPHEVCELFDAFLAAETRMIKSLEELSATCGVPGEVLKAVKENHGKATQIGKQICELASGNFPSRRERPFPGPCETLWARLSCGLTAEN